MQTNRIRMHLVAILAGGMGSLCCPAMAQQFVNPDFEIGGLAGWTVQLTSHGNTTVQTAAVVDIDGPGPLSPSMAAKFSVGRTTTVSTPNGVDIFQMLSLTAGVEYWITFDWAATRGSGIENAEGGIFAALVGDEVFDVQSAGPTGPALPKYGSIEGVVIPAVSGEYRVGARITRPHVPVSELFQWVDNFQISMPVQGACCMHDGSCRFVSAATCQALDGIYRGDGVACAGANCPMPGACCLFLNCEVLSEVECGRLNGSYRGHGVNCASVPCPPQGTLMPLPSQGGIYISQEFSRGFWFQAPVDFAIRGVRVPDPAAQGLQNLEIVRFGGYPPSSSANATNNFVSLARHIGAFSGGIIPVNIQVQAGDRIGVLGNCGAATMYHSTGDGGMVTNIFGEPATLVRLTMNGNMIFEPVRDLYSTVTTGTVIARVEVYYAQASGGCYANCDSSTTSPILNVDDFTCFINAFAQATSLPAAQQIEHYANCDGSTITPVLNVDDFTCFINAFAAGCP